MNSFWDTLRHLGPARLAIMAVVIFTLLMFFVFVSFRISEPSMSVIYSDLSQIDSSQIAGKLEESQIRYSVSEDGTTVRVPKDQVGRARMLLAEEGLPNGGSLGYEIFDRKSGFGTTNFVQNINQVRALEGELARSVSALQTVRSARVHLVLPQRELFSRESAPASASVFITLASTEQLSSQQVASIQFLVGRAVPQLSPERVSIVDSRGNLLARGDGEGGGVAVSGRSNEMRVALEQRYTRAIEDLVGRTVGFGRVRANVTADINFDRITTNEEIYDPEGQVVRSTQVSEETDTEAEKDSGQVGIGNNLPGLVESLDGRTGSQSESSRLEEVTNFEISRTVRSKVSEVGEINKLSVAVLIDGTYIENEAGEQVYQPRSEEDLEKIRTLVQSAIGYEADRGDSIEVVNLRFADIVTEIEQKQDLVMGFERSELLDAAEIITVAIMIVLVVLLVLQPMVSKLLPAGGFGGGMRDDEMGDPMLMSGGGMGAARLPSPGGGGTASMAAGGGGAPSMNFPDEEDDDDMPPPPKREESMIDMSQVEGKVKASSIKKVEDIVTQYPNESVSVIRNWMTQEG